MMCEKCGANKATTHIRTVVNGKVYEMHLCSNCAKNQNDIKNNNLIQMLSGVFGDTQNTELKINVLRCDCCGNTFNDIASSGKCGCANCYTVFNEQLLPYIKRVHGSTEHIGKVPNKSSFEKSTVDMVEQLRQELKLLVEKENYEQAAVIRDKIKLLEEGV